MRIAISAEGTGPSAQVDPRFGRARRFVIYDTDTGRSESLSNDQAVGRTQGAGIQTARQIIDQNAVVVLTGHCGPNAFQTLTEAGVQVVLGASGNVEEAVRLFQTGELKPAANPDVQGHS